MKNENFWRNLKNKNIILEKKREEYGYRIR